MKVACWESAFERQMILFTRRQLIEFYNLQTKKVREIMGVTRIGRYIVFIHQSDVERGDQSPSILNVKFQPIRLAAG